MICLTRISRAALKDIRLTDDALLMPVNHNCVHWKLATRAALLVSICGVEVVIHISQTIELRLLIQHINRSACPTTQPM